MLNINTIKNYKIVRDDYRKNLMLVEFHQTDFS